MWRGPLTLGKVCGGMISTFISSGHATRLQIEAVEERGLGCSMSFRSPMGASRRKAHDWGLNITELACVSKALCLI